VTIRSNRIGVDVGCGHRPFLAAVALDGKTATPTMVRSS
jgi:hypothetical protein